MGKSVVPQGLPKGERHLVSLNPLTLEIEEHALEDAVHCGGMGVLDLNVSQQVKKLDGIPGLDDSLDGCVGPDALPGPDEALHAGEGEVDGQGRHVRLLCCEEACCVGDKLNAWNCEAVHRKGE